jgi:hypothetical protein
MSDPNVAGKEGRVYAENKPVYDIMAKFKFIRKAAKHREPEENDSEGYPQPEVLAAISV